MSIYVGNLPFSSTEEGISELFSAYGEVTKVAIIKDRETGRSKGFGFVEMSNGAQEAINALNGHELEGRSIVVNEARPRQ
tara:strand:- start:366 stop:605 length:240 start_codon:yes stop_codon:yes gene_type:complete